MTIEKTIDELMNFVNKFFITVYRLSFKSTSIIKEPNLAASKGMLGYPNVYCDPINYKNFNKFNEPKWSRQNTATHPFDVLFGFKYLFLSIITFVWVILLL